MKVKRANNSLVLLWKQFWLYRNPKSFFGTPQGSLDHILKIVVLLIPVGNAKISSQPFDYPPWEKTKSTHYVQHMCTHTHTHTHTIQGQFPHSFFLNPLSEKPQVKISTPSRPSAEIPLLEAGCQPVLQMVASCLSTEPSENNKWLLEGLHLASLTG